MKARRRFIPTRRDHAELRAARRVRGEPGRRGPTERRSCARCNARSTAWSKPRWRSIAREITRGPNDFSITLRAAEGGSVPAADQRGCVDGRTRSSRRAPPASSATVRRFASRRSRSVHERSLADRLGRRARSFVRSRRIRARRAMSRARLLVCSRRSHFGRHARQRARAAGKGRPAR